MTVTDRTDATDAEFRDRIAPFESAPTPPEIVEARVVEEVAREIADAEDAHGPFYFPCLCGWEAGFGAGWEDRGDRHRLLSIATAAVAGYRATQDGGAEEAVAAIEAAWDEQCAGNRNEDVCESCRAYADAIASVRYALAPQAGGEPCAACGDPECAGPSGRHQPAEFVNFVLAPPDTDEGGW